MKTIYLVVGVALYACCHVNSAPLDVLCGDESCFTKECTHFTSTNAYSKFIDLATLKDVKSQDSIVRLPFYASGHRDAFILLSRMENPDWALDNVYEILIGGSSNRVTVRRGRQILKEVLISKTLDAEKATHFLLEINVSGEIVLYSSQFKDKPLIVAHDPNPSPVQYVSFGTYVDFFYDCKKDTPFKTVPKYPIENINLLATDKAQNYDLQKCKHVQVQENEYQKFIPIKDIVGDQYENQIINIPLLIQGGKNAQIALISTDKPNWETDNIYEFVIGGWDNSGVAVRRRKNGEELRSEKIWNIINKLSPTKFTLSITPTGKILLFSDLSAYKPLIWTFDSDPLPIKYISFASNQSEIVDFYYGCPQFTQELPMAGLGIVPVVASLATSIVATITKPITTTIDALLPDKSRVERSAVIDFLTHPLLENPLLYDHVDSKALARFCEYTETWTDLVESSVFVKDVWRPKGYMLRFIVYVQSIEDARILLSTASAVYEIRLGSAGNTLSQIIRQRDGKVLAEIHEQNILSESEPLRVIVELSNDGVLNVFTAHNPFVPLLKAIIPPFTEINLISFASSTRAQFYYNINEDDLLHKPLDIDTVLENLEKVKHPLLALVDYPLGFADLFFKKYFHVLYTTPELNDKYTQWIKLADIKGIRPDGYLLRFPFYIQGPANAHILLSPTENPSLGENAYEFVIGGLNNNRIEIRKRINGISLVDVRIPNVLNEFGRKKFVIEISTKGEIKLYSEDNPYRPLAIAFDPNPFDLKFFSFKNQNSEKLQFIYGNPPHLDHSEIIADLLATEKKPFLVHPLLREWNNNDLKIDLKTLALHSKHYDAHTSAIEFMPINPNYIQKGYVLRMPVYLLGSNEAVIMLSNTKNPTPADKLYKIVIGANHNTVSSIVIIGDGLKATANEQQILSAATPIKLIVEIASDGWIKVFTSRNPFKPLLSCLDANPLDVKYVSFWSPYRLQVFYDLDLLTEPFVSTVIGETDIAKHPLLTTQDYPIGLTEAFFAKYFKHLKSKLDANDKYEEFADLKEIEHIRSDEYFIRMPFYIRAKEDAHILLSATPNPTKDDAYEIVIGAAQNTRIVIRKGINGIVLTDVFWPNPLSEHRLKKFVIEIYSVGDIKLYSEDNLYVPIARAFDGIPSHVRYLSIKNPNNEQVELFYGNNWQKVKENVDDLTKDIPMKMHPVLGLFKRIVERLAVPLLWQHSKYYESWSTVYTKFIKVEESWLRPSNAQLKLRFPVIVQGSKDARILLSSTQLENALNGNVYEIRVGGDDNSLISIGRKINGEIIGQVYEQDILSPFDLTLLIVEISTSGQISIWSSHNPWAPLLTVSDPHSFDVKYISFASLGRVQFFYDFNLDTLKQLVPVVDVEPIRPPKHPLFTGLEYPIGFSNLYFEKYTKEYVTSPDKPDQYLHFGKLSDIQISGAEGYYTRIVFYVKGSQSAHILISSVENPTENDDAYELVIGDRGNTHVILRKRINGAVLADVYWPNILSKYKRTKFVFEVRTDGLIRLTSEFDTFNPLLVAFDPVPIKMEYFSAKTSFPEKVTFNYGNWLAKLPSDIENIKNELALTVYKTLEKNTLWKNFQFKDTYTLFKTGKYFESLQRAFKKVVPVSEVLRPSGYKLRYPVYTQGIGVAKIRLSSVELPDLDTETYYEIELGNAWSRILKNGVELTRVYEQNLMDLYKPTKWFIEMSADGLIKVFSHHNQWAPLMTADTTPININYIAFASESRIKFFYEVNEALQPTAHPENIPTTIDTYVKHPLLKVIEYPIGLADFFFEKYYRTFVTDQDAPLTYTKWINLNEIEDSRPNGYFLRVPFYLHGGNEANIVVSTKENPSELDVAYEFVLGGWLPGHVIIRKGINGPILTESYFPNALSLWRKKKFVLDIQRDGHIRIFSEDLPYFPIAATYDSIPENVKFNYLSVKNIFGKPLILSYRKPESESPTKPYAELLTEVYGKVNIHSLFGNWKKLQAVDLKLLSQNGKYVESWEPSFKEFVPIADKYRPVNYALQFPVWIQAARDVHIFFSSNNSVDGGIFDIYIGAEDNTVIKVHSIVDGVDKYWRAPAQNILLATKPLKMVIEWTVDGALQIFTSHNPYVPRLSINVKPGLLPIKYVSFAATPKYPAQIVHDVIEEAITHRPVQPISPIDIVKHPLLAALDYPIGFSKLFFQDYFQRIVTAGEGIGKTWLKLRDFNGLRPMGYLLRAPFYIQSTVESIVLFSEIENPREWDNVYELSIGGHGNSRVTLRKRINGAILADIYWHNVLSANPKKFVFEVTLDGHISLWSEDNPLVALITAFDPKPFSINYVTFNTPYSQGSTFYISDVPLGCTEKIREHLLQKYFASAIVHPLLRIWDSLAPKITLENLIQYGKYYESFSSAYDQFITITDQYRPFGYKLRYPLYISGDNQVQILLSTLSKPGPDDDVYEITIGRNLAQIRNRLIGGDVKQVTEMGILSPHKIVKLVIEVTNEGVVSLFSSHNPWVPLLSVKYANPFDVKYISFASHGRAQFFYGVLEDIIQKLPVVSEMVSELETIVHGKHPLLEKFDYPVGLAELFFNKFYNVFVTTPLTIINQYTKFVRLNDFIDVWPNNYIARVPFYVRGNHNAHVLFSTTENPTPYDDAYELVIDGCSNNYVILRKRIDGSIVAKAYWPNIISDSRRTKFVFEVMVNGRVQLYSDVNPNKPILSFFDPKPVHIQFVSFKSDSNERVEFFWGKNPTMPIENIVQDLITGNYGQKTIHPEFINWNKLLPMLNVKNLILKNIFYVESWRSDILSLVPDDSWKSKGFPLRFPVYIQGSGEARIILSSVQNPSSDDDSVYEIRIGAANNAITWISKQIDGEPVAKVFEQNLLCPLKPVKIVIEVASDGLIQVFSSYNPYVPLISWKDPNPFIINHISFASVGRVEFFYGVDEKAVLNLPHVVKEIVKHPLLSVLDFTAALTDTLLQKVVRVFEALPFQTNKYTQFIKINQFEGAQPTGYVLRWPFAIQGSGNAHILVSPIINPTESDDAYEIVIGAWDNHHIIIRKRINGVVLADVYLPRVLSATKLKKFVLDISEDGEIQLFSEDDLFNPIITAYDVLPLKVKYVSFKNLLSEKLRFYYGFYPSKKIDPLVPVINPLIVDPLALVVKPIVDVVEWKLNIDYQILRLLTTKLLAQNSKIYESWGKAYGNPVQLTEKYQPAGYLVQFPLYVQGIHDAYIQFAASENAPTDLYEIQIGPTSQYIKKNGILLVSSNESGLLAADKPTKILIEITTDGIIKVFTANNLYAPLLYARDSAPIRVKNMRFASLSRVLFFYDIDEAKIVANKGTLLNPIKAIVHPLFSLVKIPLNALNIFFGSHFKVYKPVVANKYGNWFKLSDIENSKPSGFVTQFSFFIQGPANAHVVFSPIENPSLTENVYEVMIGGFGNTRVMIRKRINGHILADAMIPNVLNPLKKKQFVFEVSNDGEIKLFSEDSTKPLVVAFDPKPLSLAYFSFKNLNNEKLSFFYGYNEKQLPNVIAPVFEIITKRPFGLRPILPQLDVLNVRKNVREGLFGGILAPKPTQVVETVQPATPVQQVEIPEDPVKFEPVVLHPLFEEILPVDADLFTLVKHSQYVESWSSDVPTSLVKVTSNLKPSGFILRFPFYVRGPRDAYIRLWPTDTTNTAQDYYEIQLGAVGNSVARILRSGKVLAEIVEENLLNEWQLNKVVIEVTIGGVINVYTAQNRWAPLLTAVDPNPIYVKYISFGSDTRIQYFYDVNEKLWSQTLLNAPVTQIEQTNHSLFSVVRAPIEHEDIWLNKHFSVLSASKATRQTEEQLIKLDDFKLAKSDGFKVRLPVFINGLQNVRIYLAPTSTYNVNNDAYVIDIGTWMNSRIEIRKRSNGPIIAKAVVPNVLSNMRAKMFIVEVTEDGWIRVFSEDDHVKPLISTFDPIPVDVKYVSFSSYGDEPVKFYYDYESRGAVENLLSGLIPTKYNLHDLIKYCESYESTTTEFKSFIKINQIESAQVSQFGKTFSFYMDGTKDVSLVLAGVQAPKPDVDFVYEILLGSIFERKPVVVRHKLADQLWYDALLDAKMVKITVEIGNDSIRIFRNDEANPWLEEKIDVNVRLDYVSAGAQYGSVQFYYNCSI